MYLSHFITNQLYMNHVALCESHKKVSNSSAVPQHYTPHVTSTYTNFLLVIDSIVLQHIKTHKKMLPKTTLLKLQYHLNFAPKTIKFSNMKIK